MKGKFLTIEGTEGVGKSTNIEFIRDYFAQKGINLLLTREPGGTPLAEEMRDLLLKNREEKFDPSAELLAIFSARAQHLNTVIVPALARGDWVLSDRFTDATFAYQGYGRGLDISMIAALEHMVQKDLRPDCVFLLDIDVQVGLRRASQRAALDRFETESLAFFERVRQGYLQRAKAHPESYKVINADQSLQGVQSELAAAIDGLLES